MGARAGCVEQRVIGSLLEKERTVPDTYPMTLNGVRTACNQTSGRDPVLALGELEVQAGARPPARRRASPGCIHPSHGARTPKHRQVLDEVLGLDGAERAVVTLLLLRGPQTPGELRSRSDRLHDFDSLDQVQAALHMLSVRDEPLVEELPRQPGQKETRWVHRLGPSEATANPPTSRRPSFPTGESATRGRRRLRRGGDGLRRPAPRRARPQAVRPLAARADRRRSPTAAPWPTSAADPARSPRTSRWRAPTSPASTSPRHGRRGPSPLPRPAVRGRRPDGAPAPTAGR